METDSSERKEIARRRLLRLLEQRRPDLDESEREQFVHLAIDNLDFRGDLTYFWKGIYEVPIV